MGENKKTTSESAPGMVEIMELMKANQAKDKELADLNNKILEEKERQVKLLEEEVALLKEEVAFLKEQRDAADEECEMFYGIMKNGLADEFIKISEFMFVREGEKQLFRRKG